MYWEVQTVPTAQKAVRADGIGRTLPPHDRYLPTMPVWWLVIINFYWSSWNGKRHCTNRRKYFVWYICCMLRLKNGVSASLHVWRWHTHAEEKARRQRCAHAKYILLRNNVMSSFSITGKRSEKPHHPKYLCTTSLVTYKTCDEEEKTRFFNTSSFLRICIDNFMVNTSLWRKTCSEFFLNVIHWLNTHRSSRYLCNRYVRRGTLETGTSCVTFRCGYAFFAFPK